MGGSPYHIKVKNAILPDDGRQPVLLDIERRSEYALEQIYNVVDSRFLSCLLFIITNLLLPSYKPPTPKALAHALNVWQRFGTLRPSLL